jgi:4-amino-4-deoxychorismate lyase
MAGPGGDIIGGTMTNLFLWDGAGLLTPAVDGCGIAGTVRGLAMDLATVMGIPCVETRLARADLIGARGLFLTNSLAGVWPVRRLDAHEYDPEDLPLGLIRALWQEAQSPEGPGQ